MDRASAGLQTAPQTSSIRDLLRHLNLDRRTLVRTARTGIGEYVDGEVALRHGWKPKMMSGTPKEKKELYGDLAKAIKRMEEFSEPYISAMRIISDGSLRQLARIAGPGAKQSIETALSYRGARYIFDEQGISVSVEGRQRIQVKKEKISPTCDACIRIAAGFMRLKDALNLMEVATDPSVYENVRNTNEFPEARIGKCFEVVREIDAAQAQIKEGYKFLLKKAGLPPAEKRLVAETLELLRDADRRPRTQVAQWYAALQFHEKPWTLFYKASLTTLMASVAGAFYSLYPFLTGLAHDTGMLLASAAWTIGSGFAVYFSTDAGPKTVRWIRTLDEKIIRYKWR